MNKLAGRHVHGMHLHADEITARDTLGLITVLGCPPLPPTRLLLHLPPTPLTLRRHRPIGSQLIEAAEAAVTLRTICTVTG